MIKTTHIMLGMALAASFMLAGCGPASTTTATATKAASQTSTSDSKSGDGQGPGGNSDQRAAIEACLKKAGLADKLPQRGKMGDASERPSGPPTGQPSSGGAGGVRHRGGPFADPDVQKALKACGIELPQRPSGPGQQPS